MVGTTDYVEFQNRLYKLRSLYINEDWGGPYWIGSAHLQSLVWNDQYGWPSREAQQLDEQIFFYIPIHWFKLSDDDLRDMILPNL
jgi:hypothetical protein